MTLKSMTGFARADGALGATSWHWEVRAVNARGLDLRLRLASGYEALEPRVREAAARHFQRGAIQVSLTATRSEGITEIRLNEAQLGQVLRAAGRARALGCGGEPSVDGVLAIKGVLEFVEADDSEAAAEARAAAMLASLETALGGVVAARGGEGARLARVLADQIDEIEQIVGAVAAAPSRSIAAVEQRLADQVARLVDVHASIDPTRLHQEAVMLATRADVEEELKRLSAHIAAARDLVASGAGAGRKLDFLTQEFNREANTLCSKANDIEVTRLGLALKSVIDQMREQVQNIE